MRRNHKLLKRAGLQHVVCTVKADACLAAVTAAELGLSLSLASTGRDNTSYVTSLAVGMLGGD